ncbi:hypothetical protein Salat_0108900 [Sesamum alatum]|uniref:DUF4408 domain-containing protein n=1 Tax=Sesamum alatum TaxID=300844 RepID=A0AAE2CXJ4_9LAMI|nr:hypothetical protein Salat_0108900 [Sesamum alatum]
MDSFKFHDIRLEKANAISRYHRIRRITTLFKFLELFVFLIILSRFSTQFSFPLSVFSTEYFRGISGTLISPRFVFVVGNAIVIVLFLISGQFPGKKGEKTTDFYDEYVERCRGNQQTCIKEEVKALKAYKYSVCSDEKKMIRSHSQNLERAVHGEERRRDLRRSMSEKCRKSVHSGRKEAAGVAAPVSSYAEDRMSSEEFRRTVEAFIARQQRFLREEEDFSAVVSI